jgi:hypothetical protein
LSYENDQFQDDNKLITVEQFAQHFLNLSADCAAQTVDDLCELEILEFGGAAHCGWFNRDITNPYIDRNVTSDRETAIRRWAALK